MSALHQAVVDYLEIRRALGYKLRHAGQLLPQFVSFLERQDAAFITTELAVRWATQPTDVSAGWWADRLAIVRRFAEHLRALDPRTQVPPTRLLPCRSPRVKPYLYSDEEIMRIMRSAEDLNGLLRSRTYVTLIGLMATTGMRVGEVIALDRHDIDWRHRLLVVRHGKLGKSREIVLHRTTMQALNQYARKRDRVFPHPRSRSFFLSVRGTRISDTTVHLCFRHLLERAAISSVRRAPRMHDLRHAFAVKTVLGWYRAGLDVEARLPWLSAFLGHTGPISTYWYLTAVPELLNLASERLERNLKGLS
jgi:integrase/recombinase XerD